MSEATKQMLDLPWRLDFRPGQLGDDSMDYAVLDASGKGRMDNTPYYNSAPSEEDAEFIVRAVNSHYDMLAALKAAAPWMRNGDYDSRGGLIEMDRLAGILEAAISRAESTLPADRKE